MGTAMNSDVVLEFDRTFFNDYVPNSQKKILGLVGIDIRRYSQRLIGRPVKLGKNSQKRKNPRQIYRAWELRSGYAPALSVTVQTIPVRKGRGYSIKAGITPFKNVAKNKDGGLSGEEWLSKMESGGRFFASSALLEYQTDQEANKILKQKRIKF